MKIRLHMTICMPLTGIYIPYIENRFSYNLLLYKSYKLIRKLQV